MKPELTLDEWKLVLHGLQFAASVPGFRPQYNPLPWTTEFVKVHKKIETAVAEMCEEA